MLTTKEQIEKLNQAKDAIKFVYKNVENDDLKVQLEGAEGWLNAAKDTINQTDDKNTGNHYK
jgi:hypothetical protein